MAGPIASRTILTTFVLILRLVVQAGTLLLVTRMLGPQNYGVFAGLVALGMTLGTLSTFGSQMLMLEELSAKPDSKNDVLCFALPLTLLFSSLLLVVFLLLGLFLAEGAGVSVIVLVAVGVADIVLLPTLSFPAMEYLARGRTALSQLLSTLPLVLRFKVALLVLLVKPEDPLLSFAIGYSVVTFASLVIVTASAQISWPHPTRWRLPIMSELQNAFGYAAVSVSKISPGELDKTLALKLLPLSSAGLYAAGSRVIGATTLPVIAMVLSALPTLFRTRQIKSGGGQLLQVMFSIAFGYGIALAIGLWILAPFLAALFGHQYLGIVEVVRWLCIAIPGMTTRIVAGNILMTNGNAWTRVGCEAIGLMVLAAFALSLAPALGILGMAIAFVGAEWSMAIMGAIFVIKNKSLKSLVDRWH